MKIQYPFFLLFLIIISCSSDKTDKTPTPESVYNQAMEYFNDENYFKAKQKFDIIKLQYPASEYAEKAQYYIAECEYFEGNYILAAFNYNNLRRIYPSTSYSKEAMFKAAKCYYELSPSYERDQEYTFKAIESLQEFQYIYPNDSLSTESSKLIEELRDKLGHKQFQIAEIYMKLEAPRAALIYYDEVINNYDDTKYFEDAFFGKIKALEFMNRFDEAFGLIDIYKRKFPTGVHIDMIQELVKSMKEEEKNDRK